MARDFLADKNSDDYNFDVPKLKLLSIIGRTEPTNFGELCNGMKKLNIYPSDKTGWGFVFRTLGEFASYGLIEHKQKSGKFESAQLTEAGATIIRQFADGQRELLAPCIEEDEDKKLEELGSQYYEGKYSFSKDKPF